jgi:enamine deaminase RidA (YjgF/YER057c/UK114 family)
MRRLISSGSPFEAEAGYSRAVVDGGFVFVAGTTGFDYARMTISDDPAEQARQALRNIEAALTEAGARLADIARVRYYLPDATDWPRIVPVLGEAFGKGPPGGDGAHLWPDRPAHEDRDRGHRAPRRHERVVRRTE